MDQPTILLLITVLLTTAAVQLTSASASCYRCSDGPDGIGYGYIDPNCAEYYYSGLTYDSDGGHGCVIKLYNNGDVTRGSTYEHYGDGHCEYLSDSTLCYCKDKYCNTGSYCEHCGYPKPTPGTTDATTTTAEPPSPTTDVTPATLSCYYCIDCATVDEDTTPIVEDNFLSCTTIVIVESSLVIRGGSYDAQSDGKCVENKGSLQCWCTGDSCNKNAISY
ncbi:unnamed protein product [Meganyctiphanes norvegica]|uniref:Protein sleepless n=1 Tax=Meganyctiphanes norvegica TaxID=48144 RepID=A0AAV2SY59_MEGNR